MKKIILIYDFWEGLNICIFDYSKRSGGKIIISYGNEFCGGNDVKL